MAGDKFAVHISSASGIEVKLTVQFVFLVHDPHCCLRCMNYHALPPNQPCVPVFQHAS